MSEYAIRLRFLLPPGQRLHHAEQVIEIPLDDGRSLKLTAVGGGPIEETHNLVVRTGGFSSEAEALEFGKRLKRALRISFAQLSYGVDLGNDSATTGVGQVVRDRARGMGFVLSGDVHGLCVFPEEPPVTCISCRGSGQVYRPIDDLSMRCKEAFRHDVAITPRQELGLELFSLSHFETSLRARFLTLFSAIESVIELKQRSHDARAHVDELVKMTQACSLLGAEERNQLVSALGNLRSESIATACRGYVADHGNEKDSDLWKQCVPVRNELLHRGETSANLAALVPQLSNVVSSVLLKRILGDGS